LLQISIGIVDLGAAALAMYVLIPAGLDIGIFRVIAVFIAATLLGFASHAPAGIGVFDAAILIGLGGEGRESLIAALLIIPSLVSLPSLCDRTWLVRRSGGVEEHAREALEHDPEKWVPVFREDHAQTKR